MAQSLLFGTVAAPSFGTSGALFGMKTAQLLAQSLLFGTLAAPSFGTSGALFGMKAGVAVVLAQLLAAQSEDQ